MKVTYIDHMGTDLSVVNAARVSFGKASDWVYDTTFGSDLKGLSKRDKGLIRFLARGCTSGDWESMRDDILHNFESWEEVDELLRHIKNMPTHWTPFGHTSITLHMKAPIFIARQLGKHQVGMVWNEVSRRYVTDEPEFYHPGVWRLAADNVKQGSSDKTIVGPKGPPKGPWLKGGDWVSEIYDNALEVYGTLLDAGVCPEQARMVLPQSMYTEWYWTGNLYAFANVFIQRSDSHAQREVQEVARQIGEIVEPFFPVSWAALTA